MFANISYFCSISSSRKNHVSLLSNVVLQVKLFNVWKLHKMSHIRHEPKFGQQMLMEVFWNCWGKRYKKLLNFWTESDTILLWVFIEFHIIPLKNLLKSVIWEMVFMGLIDFHKEIFWGKWNGSCFFFFCFFLHKNLKSSGVLVMGGGEELARAVKQSRGFGRLPPNNKQINQPSTINQQTSNINNQPSTTKPEQITKKKHFSKNTLKQSH